MISSIIKEKMKKDYRNNNKTIADIASTYGHSAASVEKIIFPNGKKGIAKVVVKSTIKPSLKKKSDIMVKAGKKAYIKRLQNLGKPIPPKYLADMRGELSVIAKSEATIHSKSLIGNVESRKAAISAIENAVYIIQENLKLLK